MARIGGSRKSGSTSGILRRERKKNLPKCRFKKPEDAKKSRVGEESKGRCRRKIRSSQPRRNREGYEPGGIRHADDRGKLKKMFGETPVCLKTKPKEKANTDGGIAENLENAAGAAPKRRSTCGLKPGRAGSCKKWELKRKVRRKENSVETLHQETQRKWGPFNEGKAEKALRGSRRRKKGFASDPRFNKGTIEKRGKKTWSENLAHSQGKKWKKNRRRPKVGVGGSDSTKEFSCGSIAYWKGRVEYYLVKLKK